MVLLAREEIRLIKMGVKNVIQELMVLVKVLPHRFLQSIKRCTAFI